MEEKEFNIDEALKKLEEINKRMQNKDIELKESLSLYKEAIELANKCKENLEAVKVEIEKLNGANE